MDAYKTLSPESKHRKVKRVEVKGYKTGTNVHKKDSLNIDLSYITPTNYGGFIDVETNEISKDIPSRNQWIQPAQIVLRAFSPIEEADIKAKDIRRRKGLHNEKRSMLSNRPITTIELNIFETDSFKPTNNQSFNGQNDKSK